MEAGLKYQACCCVTGWCGCHCRQPPSCRTPLVLPLVWEPLCGGGERRRVTENRKWKIPVWSAVVVDQVWTAEQRSEQEGAEGADSCCSPTSSPSTTAHQLGLGPSARYRGPQLSQDQLRQPRWRVVGGEWKRMEGRGTTAYIFAFWECWPSLFLMSTMNTAFLTVYTSCIWPSKGPLMHI